MHNSRVFGTQPDLVGHTLEAIVAESFVHSGQLVSDANVVFLKCAGEWYRLVLDSGTVHWRIEKEQPKPWSIPEKHWSYPHRAIGDDFGLTGVPIKHAALHEGGANIEFTLTFEDDRRLVITNYNDRTSYRIDPQ